MKKICKFCGKEFSTKHKEQEYCSRKCFAESIRKDLTGQKFGRLTVIKRVGSNKHGQTMWKCLCSCGNYTTVAGYNLKSGGTTSCGCYAHEKFVESGKNKFTHHKSKHRLYRAWSRIKSRCFNKNMACYNRYGGRGITICQEWIDDFMSFYNWSMANGYRDDLTIDRIDNNGNYEPSNCRWVGYTEQIRNRRNTVKLTINNITKPLAEWAEELNISYTALYQRYKNRKALIK